MTAASSHAGKNSDNPNRRNQHLLTLRRGIADKVARMGDPLGSKTRKPGERVTTTGLYRIDHDSHRLMHHAIISKGMVFPRCRTCGDQVRFSLVRSINGPVIPFRSSEILEQYPNSPSSSR